MAIKAEEPETITINSYQKVWGYEKKLYQITDNLSLPVPVVEADAKYFLAALAVVGAIWLVFKFPIPSVSVGLLIFIGIPAGTTAILRYKSFDGKNPFTFFGDWLKFMLTNTKETEFFIRVTDEPAHVAVWRIGWRHRLRMQQEGKTQK